MSKLIEKLTALAHLDPDEIVIHISKLGWVKGENMTADQHAKLSMDRVRIVIWVSDRWRDYGDYSMRDFPLRYCHQNLPKHWLIPINEWERNVWPPSH